VTGRSVLGKLSSDQTKGTIDETAADVTRIGGQGIPIQCDHTQEEQVGKLFERVKQEQHDRFDLLVNVVWGGYENYKPDLFQAPFWKTSASSFDSMFRSGLFAQFLTSKHAAPLMTAAKKGLIVHVSAGDFEGKEMQYFYANNSTAEPSYSDTNFQAPFAVPGGKYPGMALYDVAKLSLNRLAIAQAHDLKEYGVTSLCLHPGFVYTERVERFTEEGLPDPNEFAESPRYIGRAVVALCLDENLRQKSGKVFAVGHLAKEYKFTDIDGKYWPPFNIPEKQ
ncbi:SDR family NAD(P)-dependent oxidoreductase, partial [Brasilonema sp. CT11]|nr:SDR family NAD(P)-dependent oxidoreductase [Brasilonema sp. CT11]